MAWAGIERSRPFQFRGCDLTGEYLRCAKEEVRVRFPATAPIPISRAPACAAESPKLSLPGAAPGRLANLSWGRGRRVMHLPCKQTQAGALPAASTRFNRRENEIQVSLINSSLRGCNSRPRHHCLRRSHQGSDPAALTVNQVSQNKAGRSDELERYQRFPTSLCSELRLGKPFQDPVAQSAERPRCLREG